MTRKKAQTNQASLDTIGSRLRWAINRRPAEGRERGLRKFARDLKARGGPDGVTLTSISTYLSDKVAPSADWIAEAADVLGVRAAWLAFGEGAPTEAEQVIVRLDAEGEAIARALNDTFPPLQDPRLAHAAAALYRLWLQLDSVTRSDGRPEIEKWKMVARATGKAAFAPIQSLGLDTSKVSRANVETYTILVSLAIGALIGSPPNVLTVDRPRPKGQAGKPTR